MNKYKSSIFFLKIFLIIFFNLNFIIKRTKSNNLKNETKVCLCTIVKNENLYIREFIEHYQKIGYDNIFIYDNNDKNGEKLDEVIKDYITNGFVKIINYRERDKNSRPQFEAYKDCYERNNKIYDWLSFFDVDELLEINEKYKKIQNFFGDQIFKNCQNIKINWLWFEDENNLHYENKSLQERIKKFSFDNPVNQHIKSTVKGNLPINFWNKTLNPHCSVLNFTACGSSGKLVESTSPFVSPPDFANARLKHYSIKSFEEYCLKVKKGKASCPKNLSRTIIFQKYIKLYDESKHNTEKLKILYKIFNDSIYNLSLNTNINI